MTGIIEAIAIKFALVITGFYNGDLVRLGQLLDTAQTIERIIYVVGTLLVVFGAAFIVMAMVALIKEGIKIKKEKA